MGDSRPAAVVVAAGESTRMGGYPKPLLTFDGRRFVERLVATYRAADVRPVVVLGHEAGEVRARADLADAAVVYNPAYESGMLSSVRAGVRAARTAGADGVLLSPVDCPLVRQGTVERLLEAGREGDADVYHPTVGGRRGHPPLFAASTFDNLLSAPDDEGARAVVHAAGTENREVEVDDERVLVDVDTPTAYWRTVKRYEPRREG